MIAKTDRPGATKKDKKEKKSKKHDGAVLLDEQSNRLTKVQRKEIEAQADDEAGVISKEVGDLLAHLKKEHNLPDNGAQSGKKKAKAKKGKFSDASVETESDWQGTKSSEIDSTTAFPPGIAKTASPKKMKHKRKKHDSEEKSESSGIAESQSPKPKKKQKHRDALQVAKTEPHQNKKNVVQTESVEKHENYAKVEEKKPVLKIKKKKKGKSEKLVAKNAVKKQQNDNDQVETDGTNVLDVSTTTNNNINETTKDGPKPGKRIRIDRQAK